MFNSFAKELKLRSPKPSLLFPKALIVIISGNKSLSFEDNCFIISTCKLYLGAIVVIALIKVESLPPISITFLPLIDGMNMN